jgi:hypothetical protein
MANIKEGQNALDALDDQDAVGARDVADEAGEPG